MTFLTSEKLRILNLISLVIYFLIFVSIFSTIATVVDDSFARWTFKDFTEDISSSFDALPWSLWTIVLALSDIVKEIVSEFVNFGHNILPFAILPTIISYYCANRGRKNGIRTERDVWIRWYEKQKNDDGHGGTNTLPILSGSIKVNSHLKRVYNTVKYIVRTPILLVRHFLYHLIAFTILILIRSIISSFSIDLINLLVISILSTICTIASTYIEANSIINGAKSERHVWTKWYFVNSKYISQEKHHHEPPKSVDIHLYTLLKNHISTLNLILRQPISIILHFSFWIISCHFIYSLSLGYWLSLKPDRISRLLMEYSISAIVFTLIISYRKAIGRQRGKAIEQERWVNEYLDNFQGVSTNIVKKAKNSIWDLYDQFFLTLQDSVIAIFRKPQILVCHFAGWICTLILLYGFTDWLLLERHDNFVQLLVVVILTFITSILETQQETIGMIHERQEWTAWYHRLIEVKNEDLPFTELPPIIN